MHWRQPQAGTCRRLIVLAGLAAACLWQIACGGKSPLANGLERRPPLSPAEALRSFQVAEGFRVELAASEPNVADPIAMAFDESGRMYVAEMRGYPHDPPPGGGAAGRIRMLEDKDADGFFETAGVFADRLHWPSGIACWKGGIFVTAAPDILYLKDTDGDGAADIRRTVFTGFGTQKSEDIVNNLRWGLDHWIYGTTSYNGGTIRHVERDEGGGLPLGSNDFRFHPVTEAFEAVEGTGGDFGNAFDDWGNRFGSNSGNPVIHAVFPLRHWVEGMEPRRLAEPVPLADRRVYPISRPEPWRVARKEHWDRWVDTTHEMRARRFPPRELATHGYYTGGAGLAIYRGAAYPPEFAGNAFAPEPAGNLVLRTVLEASGVTFRGRRGAPGRDFLASTDNWFRPVNLVNGPDGCLYLADMYREVIEDPSAIPGEILEHVDYYTGQDMGRIYRIVPDGFARPAPPQLGQADDFELVALLGHADGWQRETAHRLLFERSAVRAAAALSASVVQSQSPRGRLHALWVLEGLDRLDEGTLVAALADTLGAMRKSAVRIAESRLPDSPALAARLAAMSGDPDAAVRFQVALAVPALGRDDAPRILASILRRNPGDEWTRAAVFAGARDDSLALVDLLLGDPSFLSNSDSAGAVSQLASIVATNEPPEAVLAVLEAAAGVRGPPGRGIRVAALSGIAAGLQREGSSLREYRDARASPPLRSVIDDALAEAAAVAADRDPADEAERTRAIRLLSWAPRTEAITALATLLSPDEAASVQLAAVRSLAAHGGAEVGRVLLDRWRSYSPAVRREAAEVLFRSEERLRLFLDALAAGTVVAAQLEPARRMALLEHPSPGIRAQARRILSEVEAASPEDVIRDYRLALDMEGDASRGAEVFDRECATCHRLGGMGHEVGPDLVERASSSREELLVDILDPNRSVQSNFVNYRLDTVDGRILTGILAREYVRIVTLRRGEGFEDTVMRSRIASLTSMGLSLMPEGLADEIAPAEMADLLRFVQSQARN